MAEEIQELKDLTLSSDEVLNEKIRNWLKWDRNPATKEEIVNAVKNKEWDILKLRLCKNIAFGTAGLRAKMQAGFDSMNDLVVVQTAQGLCAYMKKQFPNNSSWSERGIVFGYDARHNSKRFAELSAAVFLANGFKICLFRNFAATPLVAFAITTLKCLAGVQVTASHNRKEDNGYKVYWENGAQIISPHDSEIQKCIRENEVPQENYWAIDEKSLFSDERVSNPYDLVTAAYYAALRKSLPESIIKSNDQCKLRFAYTAMNGVGLSYVEEAFRQVGFKNEVLVSVVGQVEPDPEFTNAPLPNPEEGKALDMAIETAKKTNCQIIIANDPDADRLAVAEKINDSNEYKLFSGNEMGALLGWWSLQIHKMRHPQKEDVSDCAMIASTVSSKILKSMAAKEGFQFFETLTGFKWMANKAIEEESAGKTVLFAFEEAIGFMISTAVRDKDGVSAAAHVASMAHYLQSEKNMTLQDKLRDIYNAYGYHTSICSYVTCADQMLIKKIFDRLRNFDNGKSRTYPKNILNGKYTIKHVRDLTIGYDSSAADGKATLPVSSSSQMITFTFDNDVIVTLRTSGTEPKMKYYAEMCGKPGDEKWDEIKQELSRMVDAIVDEFYEPQKNKLK